MSIPRLSQALAALVALSAVTMIASQAEAQRSEICRRALVCCQSVTSANGGNASTCEEFRTDEGPQCGQAMGGLLRAANALGPNVAGQCGATLPNAGTRPPLPASGQGGYSCECARAACEAMATHAGRDTTNCVAMANLPPSVCNTSATSMLEAIRPLNIPAPAACGGGAPNTGGAGGGDTTAPPTTPPGEGVPPGPGGGTASPPPVPLPPDPPDPARSPSGRLGCVMDRENAHRVMLGGQVARFVVRCSGIPLAGNPTGAGAPSNPPTRAADGRTVQIRWNTPAGQLDPLFASAAYTAPDHANPSEVRVQATVSLAGAGGRNGESVTVYRTVHVVPRHMRLDFRGEVVTHCQDVSRGSVNVGFDLVCAMGADLAVSDDFSVHSTGGGSCGTGVVSSIQLCAPQGEVRAEPEPGWTLDSASGQIDPETGVMTLQLQGSRVGFLTVYFVSGRVNRAHPVPLFPMPFTIAPDDGSTRSFGSLTTNATAGGISAFTIHAH